MYLLEIVVVGVARKFAESHGGLAVAVLRQFYCHAVSFELKVLSLPSVSLTRSFQKSSEKLTTHNYFKKLKVKKRACQGTFFSNFEGALNI